MSKERIKEIHQDFLNKLMKENIYMLAVMTHLERALNFSLENFEGNILKHKISASTIRWDDSIFRLTNYVKREIIDGSECRKSYKKRYHTRF